MVDLFNYFRRETTEVNIGAVPLGGPNSIRVQSMTNTSTQDTQACVEQAKRIVDAGGEYVRLTTQGIKEAENLMNINIGLRSQGYMVPLVADVHFNPKVADVAGGRFSPTRIGVRTPYGSRTFVGRYRCPATSCSSSRDAAHHPGRTIDLLCG